MKQLTLLAALAFTVFAVSSCTDELTLQPTSLITAGNYWNSPSQAKAGVRSMWRWFRPQASSNLFIWGAARSGLMDYGLQAPQGLEHYFQNTLSVEDTGPGWLRLYTTIYAANLALAQIPNIQFNDSAVKNRLLAQAHAMRAYVYYIMVRTWGGIPLITQPTKNFQGDLGKKAASVEAVFEQIKNDIETALSLFPDNSFADCRCRWSKPAVNTLKGDVYLWTAKLLDGGQADVKRALNALKKVQTANVRLLDNYDAIFRYNNKGNQEIIMAVHFQYNESGSMWNNLMYIRGDQIPDNISEETRQLIGLGAGLNRWGPSEYIRSKFSEDDSRKEATYAAIYKVDENGDSTFYASIVRKFRGFIQNGQRYFVDDVILYRYADVILMIAEARNLLGMNPAPQINKIRKRAYGNSFQEHKYVGGTQKENVRAILRERLLEFAFEGKRWWDLRRFEMAYEIVPSLQGREGETSLLWPITQDALSLNPQLEQNPAYAR